MSSAPIIHVDMDAFYASVEQRDDPSIAGKPVIVGGHARRGVVLAASYEVRKFGVKSAMPMARAVQLAPQAIVVSPRFEAYAEASEQVFEIFGRFTPLVEALSLDEAFLDVGGSAALFGPPAIVARKIRDAIAQEIRLPSSAGIAAVKFVAKIASDLAKPNGQLEVPAAETERFLAPLPISRMWGVGPKTEERLHALGVKTLGDIAARDPEWLERRLGDGGRRFWSLAHGIDERTVIPDREAKSIGSEDTFAEDLVGPAALEPHLHSQALRVARRMRRASVHARTVVLKLKSSDHKLHTRRRTLPEPTDDGQQLFRAAMDLLETFAPVWPVRLTGVSAHNLLQQPRQLALLEPRAARARRLNATLDEIAERFGHDAVLPADLVGREPRESLDEVRARAGASRLDLLPRHARRTPGDREVEAPAGATRRRKPTEED